ncbi:MAG TPA: hypothetical protein VH143_29730 [Kofleriaceae bacterium]|jgi:hypothetical protein|nr:hypothetical protein [Kofleriaceae bacterium]
MQFAERSRATGSIVLVLVATVAMAAALAQIAAHHRFHHRHHRSFALDMPRCREWIPPPPPAAREAIAPDPSDVTSHSYDGVLASAAPLFAPCFAHGGRATELLVTIAPDGRVRATTTRPEPETHTSRCLANVVRGLVFPPAATTVMMRVPLAPQR